MYVGDTSVHSLKTQGRKAGDRGRRGAQARRRRGAQGRVAGTTVGTACVGGGKGLTQWTAGILGSLVIGGFRRTHGQCRRWRSSERS
jgi:hypothetical protein